jgi:hypothetical protein
MDRVEVNAIIDEVHNRIWPQLKKIYTAFWAEITDPESTPTSRRQARERYMPLLNQHREYIDDAREVMRVLPPGARTRIGLYVSHGEKIIRAAERVSTVSAYGVRQNRSLHPQELDCDNKSWDWDKIMAARKRAKDKSRVSKPGRRRR